MRISSNGLFDTSVSRLNDLQSKLDKIAQQVSSGRKLANPSEDPVAAGRTLELNQSQAINQQYTRNREFAKNTLGVVDGTLTGISDTLQSINEQVVAAGSGAISVNDRLTIATILKGHRDQLLSLANTTDGAGNYLLSGTKSDKPAFVESNSGVISIYQGDTTQSAIQVDNARTLAASVTADSLFGADAAFFTGLDSLMIALNEPTTTATDLQTALNTFSGQFSTSFDNVTNAQMSVGIRMQRIDEMDKSGASREAQFTESLSALQDLDYNKALSDLSRQQLVLQAAQQTFAKLSDMSLFNFLK